MGIKTANGKNDEKFMRLALALAAKGAPSPNPYVGAIIVKSGRIIGKGFHHKAGMAHAEIEALRSLKKPSEANGATLYVTLEPCAHYGRTPPCTKAIIESGIKRVVFAMKDPNPRVKGNGGKELLGAGIEVKKGILEGGARELNEIFIKYSTTGLPFVVLKVAMSADGKTVARRGGSRWITGEKARRHARLLRGKYDAILVGINTILADNPRLTSRTRGLKDPVRIILDSKLRIPLNSRVLEGGNAIIVAAGGCAEKKRAEIEKSGAQIWVCGGGRENAGKVDIPALLSKLGKAGITSVMVEGGSKVHGSFMDKKAVDKILIYVAPKIMGGDGAKPTMDDARAGAIGKAKRLEKVKISRIGPDLLIEGYPAYG